MFEATALLEDWTEANGVLRGTIYGDTRKRFEDGSQVRTSKLVPLDQDLKTGTLATTMNSCYMLGRRVDYAKA